MAYLQNPLTLNNEQIEDHTSARLHRLGENSALGRSGFDIITRPQYISWVQQSLNRLYDTKLETTGRKTTFYNNLVRKFQRDRKLPEGEVDPATQNEIIKANERNRAYLRWVQKALESESIFADPPLTKPRSNGSYKSNGLKMGIKAFQGRKKITKDGYVGAITHTLLVMSCRCKPPGYTTKPNPKKPDIDYEAALINQLRKAKEAIDEGATFKADAATRCLILKLMKPKVDDSFVDAKRTDQYFRDSYIKHPDFEIYFFSAKKYLKSFLRRRWERGASVSVDDFITAINRIKKDMIGGMNVAYSRLTGENIYEKFRKKRIKRAFRTLANSSKSLYGCRFAVKHYKKSIDTL